MSVANANTPMDPEPRLWLHVGGRVLCLNELLGVQIFNISMTVCHGEKPARRYGSLGQRCQTHVHRGPNQHHGHPLKGPETLYKLLEHIGK